MRPGPAAWILGLSIAVMNGAARADDPSPSVDYLRDVKPLLARHCVSCHGAEQPRAGLRLDTAAGALQGGISGELVVPGSVEESELIYSVLGEGATERMPLNRPPLSDDEVAILKAWIEAGAEAPSDEVPSVADEVHWAFEPPRRPEVPPVNQDDWPINPIDRFILSRLEREGITPSPEADRATLIRRLSLDLTGLPPTPEAVAAFVHDDRPDAYDHLVDRLLASPHYGEKWARHWLDGARYADSNGYSIDAPRSIWKYRDWVIDALNQDLPFDQFTIDQIAGDLHPDASIEQVVATGFHRNTPINQEGGIDKEQFRVESIIDRVNTTATVFLGLTVACAQCHDHKYDPISQQEYYELFAFFNNVDEPEVPVASPEEVALRDELLNQIDTYLRDLRQNEPALMERMKAWETGLSPEERQKQSQEVREAFDTVFDRRNDEQHHTVFQAFIDQDESVQDHKAVVDEIRARIPLVVMTMVVRERTEPRVTRLLVQGDYTRPGDSVAPGTPRILPPLEGSSEVPSRMDLARWLVDPDNPLTARVTVNRLWQVYFGRGLVETDNDFGLQGAPPSHPELLDWLATEFLARGWSLKAMHRLIVTSATYRQASHARPELSRIDPDNRLLARQSRLRLEAELVRDAALAASGLLSPTVGGPSVFPPQPDGVMSLGQMRRSWDTDTGPERYRRGLYTFFWRATPHPQLMVFDAPDATQACTRRVRSNTPLQALTLLNDDAFFECAQALADRVLKEAPNCDEERLTHAFRLCLTRSPSETERQRLHELLEELREHDGEQIAWLTVARVLLNLDEFITRE